METQDTLDTLMSFVPRAATAMNYGGVEAAAQIFRDAGASEEMAFLLTRAAEVYRGQV